MLLVSGGGSSSTTCDNSNSSITFNDIAGLVATLSQNNKKKKPWTGIYVRCGGISVPPADFTIRRRIACFVGIGRVRFCDASSHKFLEKLMCVVVT